MADRNQEQQPQNRKVGDALRPGDVISTHNRFVGVFIPHAVLRDRNLSDGAKLLYGRLCLYSGPDGRCNPKNETLAAEFGSNVATIKRQKAELVKRGWAFFGQGGGRGNSANCYFLWHESLGTCIKDPQTGAKVSRKDLDLEAQKCALKQAVELKTSAKTRPETGAKMRHAYKEAEKIQFEKTSSSAVTKQKSVFESDDERTKPERTGNETPRQEFEMRLKERHGSTVDITHIAGIVSTELDKGAIAFEEFLDVDRQRTTGVVENPGGYYRSLAQSLVKRKSAERVKEVVESGLAIQRAAEIAKTTTAQRCGTCKHGRVGAGYCDCRLGRDLAKQEAPPPVPEQHSKAKPDTVHGANLPAAGRPPAGTRRPPEAAFLLNIAHTVVGGVEVCA